MLKAKNNLSDRDRLRIQNISALNEYGTNYTLQNMTSIEAIHTKRGQTALLKAYKQVDSDLQFIMSINDDDESLTETKLATKTKYAELLNGTLARLILIDNKSKEVVLDTAGETELAEMPQLIAKCRKYFDDIYASIGTMTASLKAVKKKPLVVHAPDDEDNDDDEDIDDDGEKVEKDDFTSALKELRLRS